MPRIDYQGYCEGCGRKVTETTGGPNCGDDLNELDEAIQRVTAILLKQKQEGEPKCQE